MGKFRDANGNIVEGTAVNPENAERVAKRIECGLSQRGPIPTLPASDVEAVTFIAFADALEQLTSQDNAQHVLGETVFNVLSKRAETLRKAVTAFGVMERKGYNLTDLLPPPESKKPKAAKPEAPVEQPA
jgi:hypothetical protein